ncbi:MAG: DUF599 domain-containing protein [Rickettsiales bacterium]|nr:DUF599 domain-containing protein [Rickettsiales bacterium]
MLTAFIPPLDLAALIFFMICWIGYNYYSEYNRNAAKSLLTVMNEYRALWMREMIRRENRTMDAIMIGNLQRSIAFFANTSIFIILGLVTMLGYQERSSEILRHIPFAQISSSFMWELKIFLLILIFIYSFFKYTWSMRQYNYAGVFVNSVPSHAEIKDSAEAVSLRGARLIGNAARHFNNGVRAYYFGLAVLAWFINAYVFIAATAWVVYVAHRREYHSGTLANLTR